MRGFESSGLARFALFSRSRTVQSPLVHSPSSTTKGKASSLVLQCLVLYLFLVGTGTVKRPLIVSCTHTHCRSTKNAIGRIHPCCCFPIPLQRQHDGSAAAVFLPPVSVRGAHVSLSVPAAWGFPGPVRRGRHRRRRGGHRWGRRLNGRGKLLW